MTHSHIFISYSHGFPSTEIATQFQRKLQVYVKARAYEIFRDDKIRAGDVWDQRIQDELNKTTHFIALINDAWCLSQPCQEELLYAINRWESSSTPRLLFPRLLFVMLENMATEHLTLNDDRKAGRLISNNPQIHTLGDLHWLGPYDKNQGLVRLAWENAGQLDDQLFDLVERLWKTPPWGSNDSIINT